MGSQCRISRGVEYVHDFVLFSFFSFSSSISPLQGEGYLFPLHSSLRHLLSVYTPVIPFNSSRKWDGVYECWKIRTYPQSKNGSINKSSLYALKLYGRRSLVTQAGQHKSEDTCNRAWMESGEGFRNNAHGIESKYQICPHLH